jgi:phytoene dehydrogenase-like protein
MRKTSYDATIVGAGPNGLTAAAVLAAAGLSVVVLEGNQRIGGGCRTESLTLPGFAHDVCSAIHPMGRISPVFRRLQLEGHGLRWVLAPSQLAHPLDDGRVALLERDADATASTLGEDHHTWDRLTRPFVERHDALFESILRPIRVSTHPWLMARFGWLALRSAQSLTRRFTGPPARALFEGCAAHSFLPLDAPGPASFGLAMATAAHVGGWPCAHGGSQTIAEALATHACAHGCEIRIGRPVRSLADVPQSRCVLFDVTPRQLDMIAGEHLSASYRARLRAYRYGTAAFKIDYALAGPIPWRSPACAQAATVHLGGTYDEIARSEADAAAGRIADAPLVVIAQQSLFDSTRAPGETHRVGLLPPAPWICRRHDLTHRAAERALRTRLPRSGPGAACHVASGAGSAQSQSDWRRHQRWVERARSVRRAPVPALEALHDIESAALPLFELDATWRRGTWHVRLLGCPGGTATHVQQRGAGCARRVPQG